jgi:hypothetical protein
LVEVKSEELILNDYRVRIANVGLGYGMSDRKEAPIPAKPFVIVLASEVFMVCNNNLISNRL